jgi:hypothetical protein
VGSITVGENGPWLQKVAAYTVQNLFYEISLASTFVTFFHFFTANSVGIFGQKNKNSAILQQCYNFNYSSAIQRFDTVDLCN